MDRFWIPPEQWGAPFSLSGEEEHHCRRVMRKREGDEIEIFDGQGRWARARVSGFTGHEVALEVTEENASREKTLQVELAVGIPKGKTFDLVIQKAVELGVTKIQPLMTDQGMVRIEEKEAAKKTAKWNRLALEASKQCGQNWLPTVASPQGFSQWIDARTSVDLEMVAALSEESRPLKEVLMSETSTRTIRILVGPEGDFSSSEYRSAFSQGFVPVTLGDLVLRVETAVIFVLSNIFCHWG